MHFDSHFAIGQLVDYGGVFYTVAAVKFTHEGKTLYDLVHSNGTYLYHIPSLEITEPVGN